MSAPLARLAVLFRESGLLTDEQWQTHVRASNSSKHIKDVLYQDVSLSTFKDLIFAEIPLPFTKRSTAAPLHQALSTQVRLTESELIAILKAFHPDVRHFAGPFLEAGLFQEEDMEAALARPDLQEIDPCERLIRHNVLRPEALARLFDNASLRRSWPYRLDLTLTLLEENQLVDPEAATKMRAGSPGAPARLDAEDLLRAVKRPLLEAAIEGLNLLETDLGAARIEANLARRFPASVVRRYSFIPLGKDDGILHVAFADPMNLALGDMLWLLTGLRVRPYAVAPQDLAKKIDALYGAAMADAHAMPATAAAPVPVVSSLERLAESASTVQLVSSIVEGAIDLGGTDIHLEPQSDNTMRVRYRIDGQLRNILKIPAEAISPVVSRIKVLANMDVTERRHPQDGHFSLEADGTHFDFRISTLPVQHGEKVVIRVLDETRVLQGLGDLGLLKEQQTLLERLCRQPYGMVLVTGPTGSGKTSTLYACLQTVNDEQVNIVTVEDPIEYQVAGVNQVQVNSEIEMGFAQGLRAILRQDPDIIMVGEIRDAETAAIAARAALTGHLVFSTMHTNTALGAFSTMTHMGIQPYMSSAAVLAVIAQRLLRRVCPECRIEVDVNPELAQALSGEDSPLGRAFTGKGCDFCLGTGFRGRTGLFEVVENTQALRGLVAKGASEAALARQAAKDGMIPILKAGRDKVIAGETSLEEVCYRALSLSGV